MPRQTLFPLLLGTLLCVGASCEPPQQAGQMNPIEEFGITANNAFYYYTDLEGATAFYTEVLGLQVVADYGFAKILQVAPTSFLTLVDEAQGMHSSEEPKTVAIALVTDQLDEWWEYLSGLDVEMKYEYNLRPDRPHDGFVAIDPEGYLLEFERFNDHPENAAFTPILLETDTVPATPSLEGAPPVLGFKATVIWTYYRDMERIQRFYEDVFGLDLLVDQGWAKIYRTSASGYVGLVDESRGMHTFSDEKAVMLSFLTDDLTGWFEYASGGAFPLVSEELSEEGPRVHAFVGSDPGGYHLEFDTFLDHEDNRALLELLDASRARNQ